MLETGGKVDAHELVCAFFEPTGRLDGEEDCSSQVDQVCVGLIFDLDLSLHLDLLVILATGCIIVVVIVAFIAFAKNLGLELCICLFVLFPLGVKLEDVQ